MIADDRASDYDKPVLRDTLFGDLPLDRWERDGDEPWASFTSAAESLRRGDVRAARQTLSDVAARAGLETRHHLEAWFALRGLGVMPPPEVASHVCGVVVDVRMADGCDTIAAYEDLSARYINHGGGVVVLDGPAAAFDSLVEGLVSSTAAAHSCIARRGSSDRSLPSDGKVRITALCPGGLISLEGAVAEIQRDPRLKAVWDAATKLLVALVDASTQ